MSKKINAWLGLVPVLILGGSFYFNAGAQAATTIGNNVSIGGTLSVTGAATTTIVTTSQYISVGGTPLSFNASYSNGSLNLAGKLSVDGTAAVSSTLIVGGAATFRGDILADVNGIPNIGAFGSAFNNIYSSGTIYGTSLNLSSGATITGAVTFTTVSSSIVTTSNYISVGATPRSFNASYTNGSANLSGNLSVDGTAAVSSTLIVGGAATFRGNILADVNNVPSLGAYGSAFKDVYTSGTIFGTNLILNGSASSSIVTTSQYLTVGGTPVSSDAGFSNGSLNAKNLSLDGTAAVSSTLIVGGTVTFRGSLLADVNGIPNIGAFGAAFNNFYSSGTIFATNISVSSTVSTTIVTSSQYLSVGGTPASFNATFVSGSLNANNLSLDGTAAVSSTLIVGGTATFRGNLLADVNGVPSLGAFGAAFNNVYASGTFFGGAASLGNLVATGTVTLATTTIPASTTLRGGVVIGDSGTNIAKHISVVVVNINMGASNAAACSTQNVTVSGVKLGDTVAVAPQSDDAAWVNGNLTGFALADDTVRLVYCGDDDNADPAAMDYRIDVWKH